MCEADGGKLMIMTAGEEHDPNLGVEIDGRYRIESLLGRGGMGAVYKATQTNMGRAVAIKLLLKEFANHTDVAKRFLREARTISQLSHVNTITVHDFGQTADGQLFIVMEHLTGRPLTDRIEEGPMPADEALRIVRQTAAALSEAHDKGIVHRDIKPDNIFLAELGGEVDEVKVLDFGIAKLLDTDEEVTQLTKAGFSVGTPSYMSPEQAQAQAEITHASDLYALGCILFECVAGRPPFVADSAVGVLMAHCTATPPTIQQIRPELRPGAAVEALTAALLEKDPSRRPETAQAVVDRIDEVLSGAGAAPRAPTGPDISFDDTRNLAALDEEDLKLATMGPPSEAPLHPSGAAGGKRGVIIAAAVAVLGLGIGAISLSGDPPPKADKPAAVPADTPEPAAAKPAPKPVEAAPRIWVRSTPAGAQVKEGGALLGLSPLELTVDSKAVRRLSLELPGYEPMAVAVDPAQRDHLEFKLTKLAPAPKPKPKVRSAPAKKKGGKARSKPERRKAPPKPKPPPSGGGDVFGGGFK